eukprot:506920-Karenia_brevis.AAC.1
MMLTVSEAQNIIEANPKKGMSGWRQLHERWNKRTKMSSVMLLEQIRSMPKCKTLDEVFGRITDLQKKYLEYEE